MKNDIKLNGLLTGIKNGDYGDFDVLLEMYRPLIEGAVSLYNISLDPDEIRQISFIALFNAVKSYDTGSEVTFGLFAKICINNAIRSELRKTANEPLGGFADISEADGPVGGPEDELIKREDFEIILKKIGSILTDYEFDVFRYYLMGYSYKEVAQKLGKDEVSVGNALSRTKAKIKNHRFL